jgi:hypothetical protein
MKPHKFTMIYKLKPEDCPKWENFYEMLQAEMDNDETIAQHLMFISEATFAYQWQS